MTSHVGTARYRRLCLQGLGASVILGAILSAVSAQATIVVARSVEQLAADAVMVVRARVNSQWSAWTPNHRRIDSFTELEVVDTWAGKAPEAIVVRTIGGRMGGVGMRISGTTRFEPGEDVVLFLSKDLAEAGGYRVLGLSQGKFKVEQQGTQLMAIPDAQGLVLARPSVAQTQEEVKPMLLSTLKARVQAATRQQQPR